MKVVIAQLIHKQGNGNDINLEFEARPRFDSDLERPEIHVAELEVWSFDKSFFAKTVKHQDYFVNCLNNDFYYSRLSTVLKATGLIQVVKEFMEPYYRKIIEVYKHFA